MYLVIAKAGNQSGHKLFGGSGRCEVCTIRKKTHTVYNNRVPTDLKCQGKPGNIKWSGKV